MSKKALFLIVPDGFRDEEYSIPKKIMEEHGVKVITCSTVSGSLTGKKGLTTTNVDILLDNVQAKDYQIILVGGGQKTFWYNKKIIAILKEMFAANKVIAAICSSAVLPAQAGLLKNKRATAFPGAEELAELEKHGVIYDGNHIVVEGKIITADGPAVAKDFALKILELATD